MKIPTEIKIKLLELINSESVLQPKLLIEQVAKKINVLPIFTDSGGWCGLNLNGDVVSALWEKPFEIRVENNKRICNLVLFQGIKNYPELSDLAPVRKDTDEICPDCKGTGTYPLPHLNIGCYCGGLGWLPKSQGIRLKV
jgi:hypothetical protein